VEKENKIPVFERPWEKNTNSIWLATTVCLHRNINKFNFPQRLDHEKRRLVSDMIEGILQKAKSFSGVNIFHADQMAPVDRDFLSEHFLVFETARNSRQGRTFITDDQGSTLVLINALDHIELHTVELEQKLEKALEKLVAIENDVEEQVPFAFSNQFGYLSSDPARCGTGLVVNAYVHVPALVYLNKLKNWDLDESRELSLTSKTNSSACLGIDQSNRSPLVFPGESQEGLIFTSLQGNLDDPVGDLLIVRNRWTLGVKEETILSSVRSAALNLVSEEKRAREKIKNEHDEYFVDCISRAIGTLQHSFAMDTSEALRTISLVKFGVELGWVKGVPVEDVNELFFDCRRAHLARRAKIEVYSRPELNKERAQYLRKIFSQAKIE